MADDVGMMRHEQRRHFEIAAGGTWRRFDVDPVALIKDYLSIMHDVSSEKVLDSRCLEDTNLHIS